MNRGNTYGRNTDGIMIWISIGHLGLLKNQKELIYYPDIDTWEIKEQNCVLGISNLWGQ